MGDVDKEVFSIPSWVTKFLLVFVALVTCTGSYVAWTETRYANRIETDFRIQAVKELNQSEIQNIKTNYEFHLEQIYKELRIIRATLGKDHS